MRVPLSALTPCPCSAACSVRLNTRCSRAEKQVEAHELTHLAAQTRSDKTAEVSFVFLDKWKVRRRLRHVLYHLLISVLTGMFSSGSGAAVCSLRTGGCCRTEPGRNAEVAHVFFCFSASRSAAFACPMRAEPQMLLGSLCGFTGPLRPAAAVHHHHHHHHHRCCCCPACSHCSVMSPVRGRAFTGRLRELLIDARGWMLGG